MQILLNTDHNVDGRQPMADHLEAQVKTALGRYGEHVTRVQAHVTDANSRLKAHPDEIHCTLEARLVGLDAVVVKDHADNAHQAIVGATTKLQRAVGAALAKHASHRREPGLGKSATEPGADAAE